jgi:hypothetical protein
MLSRALSSATVMLLVGCFAPVPAQAQAQNLEAGKSPSQIFAGTCSACHKSPRGLLKAVPAGSLPGYLRQHYTTSSDMASLLSAFLISNGATDTRYIGSQPKQEKDAKSEARPAAPPEQLDRHGHRLHAPAPSQEATRPDAPPDRIAEPDREELPPQAEPGRRGRNSKRLARPVEAPDAAKPDAEGQAPAQVASERGPDGRKSGAKLRLRLRLSKRGKPGSEELPRPNAVRSDSAKPDSANSDAAKSDSAKSDSAKSDSAKSDSAKTDAAKTDSAKDEPAKGDAAREDKPQSDIAKHESKPDGANSPVEGKSEATRIEASKPSGSGETTALRADPVPPVTPAPQASTTTVSSGAPEPTAGTSTLGAPATPLTASMPAPAPAASAGPPKPPISQ